MLPDSLNPIKACLGFGAFGSYYLLRVDLSKRSCPVLKEISQENYENLRMARSKTVTRPPQPLMGHEINGKRL